MGKKILLLFVPYGQLYGGMNIRKLRWGLPPLGLAALSAYIRQKTKCQVKLLDMQFENNPMATVLDEFQPDIIGLSATTPQMDNAYRLSRQIKKLYPHTKIVIGGPHVTALPQQTLQEEPCIDYGVVGEGEIPFLSLIEERPLSSIKSLVWRNGETIVVNQREALIDDLGSLPFPDYESLPLHSYGTFYSGNSVGMISGRGCRFRCSFCASRITHLGQYRVRPVEIFIDDIQRLLGLGIPRFDICDDTFTSIPSRVYEFIEGYQKSGLKARWSCQSRVDCLDRKMIREMHRAGLDTIHIGCESGNQEILNKNSKGIQLSQIREACVWCRQEGLTLYVYFILGLPYETEQTIRQTIDFAKALQPDYAQFSMLVPLPGTKVWEMASEGNIVRNLAKKWSDYDRYHKAIVALENVSDTQLATLYKYALRSFYLRPSYILQCLRRINSLERFKMYARMGSAFLSLLRS